MSAAQACPKRFFLVSLLLLRVSCGQALLGEETIGLDSTPEQPDGDRVSLLQVSGRQVHRTPQRQKILEAQTPKDPGLVQNRDVPEIIVDLDVSPELRWRNVTRHYINEGMFPDAFKDPDPVDLAGQVLLAAAGAMPIDEEYLRELKGIVEDLGHPNITLQGLLFRQLGYELIADVLEEKPGEIARTLFNIATPGKTGCSGLLAAKKDGTVVHGRNLDWGRPVTWRNASSGKYVTLRDTTVEVLFMKGGKPFTTSVHWPGFIGFTTAMRFDGWSMEQNTRNHSLGAPLLYGLLQRSQSMQLGLRRIMETTPDFETAVQKLYNMDWMAPQYFIVAGPGPFQGAVITVDYGGAHLAGTPPVLRLSNQTPVLHGFDLASNWHLVQTNDDHFSFPQDRRRPQEELRLAAVSQDTVSTNWVWREMLSPALYNQDTIYTTVYVPRLNSYKTYVHPNHIDQ